MTSRAWHLAIDARPRGPRGPMAAEVVLGQTMLARVLDLVNSMGASDGPVPVHARPEEHQALRELAGERWGTAFVLASGPPRAGDTVLRTDRVYDPARLRRRLLRGRSPEPAVLWRLDRPGSLESADEELVRRLSYQPLGKFWAFPLAERLADWLRPTFVRPNMVTLSAAALMLGAAGTVATGATNAPARWSVAAALAAALVLDTADGRLARLQGSSSAFGRWLDQYLDELADLALHAAIAWSAFAQDGRPLWLLLGMLYPAGKYLFLVESTLGEELERQTNNVGPGKQPRVPARVRQRRSGPALHLIGLFRRRGPLARAVHLLGHADVRWHLWIILAALGRLDLALAAYAVYFPARAFAGAIRKGALYA